MSLYGQLAGTLGIGEFNYGYNFSLPHRYLYIENAKSGCTTLKSTLGNYEILSAGLGPKLAENFLKNVHANMIGTPFTKPFQLGAQRFEALCDDSEIHIFTFVRNPLSRLVSAYLDKIKMKKAQSYQVYQHLGRELDEEVTFAEFIHALHGLHRSGASFDKHYRSQLRQCGDGRVRLDFIGRLETFEKDFESLVNKLGFDGIELLAGQRHSTNSEELLTHYYTPQLEEIVYELYEQDFTRFGYPMAIPKAIGRTELE